MSINPVDSDRYASIHQPPTMDPPDIQQNLEEEKTGAHGDVYEEARMDDVPHCLGKEALSNGIVAEEGTFVNGKLEGPGRRIFSNGDFDEGTFVNGKLEGPGRRVDRNGNVYTGNFVSDKMDGKGRITWSDGNVEEVVFKDGERAGPVLRV